MDEQELVEQLGALGWTYEPHGERTYRCPHQTEEGELTVYVRLTNNWVIASVVPFIRTKGKTPFDLSRWLLRVNRDMFLAKFAYDEDHDVVLTAELPLESLSHEEIRSAFEGLIRYAVEHRRTLREAASGA